MISRNNNSKRQKLDDINSNIVKPSVVESRKKSATTRHKDDDDDNNVIDLLTDDIIFIIFSFLKPRDMGRLSMSCNRLKKIFHSVSVQTDATKFDIRWAKYASGHKEPLAIINRNLCNLLQENYMHEFRHLYDYGFHTLENGNILTYWQLYYRDSHDKIVGSFWLVIHAANGDTLCALEFEDYWRDEREFASDKNTLIERYQDGDGNLQFVAYDLQSIENGVLKRKGLVDINHSQHISTAFALVSNKDLLYYIKYTEEDETIIKFWELNVKDAAKTELSKIKEINNDDNSILVENHHCNIVDMRCWNDFLLFRDSHSIQVWSTSDNSYIRTIKPVDDENADIVDMIIQSLKNGIDHYLVSLHRNGNIYVYSLPVVTANNSRNPSTALYRYRNSRQQLPTRYFLNYHLHFVSPCEGRLISVHEDDEKKKVISVWRLDIESNHDDNALNTGKMDLAQLEYFDYVPPKNDHDDSLRVGSNPPYNCPDEMVFPQDENFFMNSERWTTFVY